MMTLTTEVFMFVSLVVDVRIPTDVVVNDPFTTAPIVIAASVVTPDAVTLTE
jgi:hypothetical protein